MININELKVNCKNLIMINLNNYNYTPNYVNTKASHAEFNQQGIIVDEFAAELENKIREQYPDLYCDIKITVCHDNPNTSVILRVEKSRK